MTQYNDYIQYITQNSVNIQLCFSHISSQLRLLEWAHPNKKEL